MFHIRSGEAWRLRLTDYIGSVPVLRGSGVSEGFIGRERLTLVREAERLEDRIQHPQLPDLRYAIFRKRLFLFDAISDDLVLAETSLCPIVMEGHENKGHGASFWVLRDLLGMSSIITHYSISGFRSVRSAHRRHLDLAQARGESIDSANYQDYILTDTGHRLACSYDRDEHLRAAKPFSEDYPHLPEPATFL